MSRQADSIETAAGRPGSPPGELPAWLRLLFLVGALALGSVAFRRYFASPHLWGRWIGELLAAVALLGVALWERRPVAESTSRRALRRSAWAAVLGAAGLAVWLVPQPGRELPAAVAVLGAVGAFFLARWLPFAAGDVQALTGGFDEPAGRGARLAWWQWILVVAGGGTAVAAMFVNGANHLAGFLLWLASLALFVAGVWQRGGPDGGPTQVWTGDGGPPLRRRDEVLVLALTVAVALLLRVVFLYQVPAAVNSDEGRLGRSAERMWQAGFPNAFEIGWNVFPNLAFVVQYAPVRVLGTNIVNLRVSSAVVGALCLLPLFFWARRWWGNVVAALAAALLAINGEHIFWSRIGLNNIQQVLVAGLMLAAFARVLHGRRRHDWVWLGYATGLAFHTYHAAKLFPFLLAGAFVLLALGVRGLTRRCVAGVALAAAAFLMCLGPLLETMYRRWDQFYLGQSNRVDLRILLDAWQQGNIEGVRNYVSSHVLGCLLSFFSTPSPLFATFDPFVAVPFLLGLGWMLWRWRDPRHLVSLVWTLGILVIGGMITDYPPNKPRMIGFLPVVCLVPAIVAGRARELLSRLWPGRADFVFLPLALVWLGAALYQNIQTQFFAIPRVHGGDPMTEICRAIDRAPLPATIYMLGSGTGAEPKVSANDCMIAPLSERLFVGLADDPAIVPISPANYGNAVLIVDGRQRELLSLVLHYYGNADVEIVPRREGGAMYFIVTLRAEAIEKARGLRATYRTASRTWSPQDGSASLAPEEGAEFPVSVAWTGLVWIPSTGTYGLRAPGASLRIDDRPFPEGGAPVVGGWHRIDVGAAFAAKSDGIALQWLLPDTLDWLPVPHAHLHTHPVAHGLLGRYFKGSIPEPATPSEPITATPDDMHIDTVVNFDWLRGHDESPPDAFAARPGVMEWSGSVDVPAENGGRLLLEATGPTRVFLNGEPVLSVQGKAEGETAEADIGAARGRVPILVRSVRPADSNYYVWKLRLLWRKAGGDWTSFVPYHPTRSAEGATTTHGE